MCLDKNQFPLNGIYQINIGLLWHSFKHFPLSRLTATSFFSALPLELCILLLVHGDYGSPCQKVLYVPTMVHVNTILTQENTS